ncbi:MAG: PIN domain-containing protein [Candidatus Hydrothermarchaeales archaeon]
MAYLSAYVVDTAAFIRYLSDELPSKADAIFRDAESGKVQLLLPHIVIGEFIYISLKNRLKTVNSEAVIREVLLTVETAGYITPVDMDMTAWGHFLELDIPDLHDRMICAIAASKNALVISPDEEISRHVETVWD